MQYIISIIALMFALLLSGLAAWCLYLGFTASWTWFFVAAPLLASDVVAFLIASTGISILLNE